MMNVLIIKLMVQNVIKNVHIVLVVIGKEFVLHVTINFMEIIVNIHVKIVQGIKDVLLREYVLIKLIIVLTK